MAGSDGGGEGDDDRRKGELEALIVPIIVLGENVKICEQKDFQRGGGKTTMNNTYLAPFSI